MSEKHERSSPGARSACSSTLSSRSLLTHDNIIWDLLYIRVTGSFGVIKNINFEERQPDIPTQPRRAGRDHISPPPHVSVMHISAGRVRSYTWHMQLLGSLGDDGHSQARDPKSGLGYVWSRKDRMERMVPEVDPDDIEVHSPRVRTSV